MIYSKCYCYYSALDGGGKGAGGGGGGGGCDRFSCKFMNSNNFIFVGQFSVCVLTICACCFQ